MIIPLFGKHVSTFLFFFYRSARLLIGTCWFFTFMLHFIIISGFDLSWRKILSRYLLLSWSLTASLSQTSFLCMFLSDTDTELIFSTAAPWYSCTLHLYKHNEEECILHHQRCQEWARQGICQSFWSSHHFSSDHSRQRSQHIICRPTEQCNILLVNVNAISFSLFGVGI